MDILTPTNSDQLPSALDDPRGNLLRPAQLMEHSNEIKLAQAQLENPNVQDKGAVRQRIGSLKRQYESQAPRPITDGGTKDKLAAEAATLLEEILPGMLSQEEMRKNPAGSVDKHIRWERANKSKIVRWKKLQCVLNADTSDPHTWDRDAANLERFRPQGAQDRFRTDAQITGKMTYGAVPEEKWQQAFGSVAPENSALNQAKRVADASVISAAVPPVAVASVRQPLTEERRRAIAENLKRGREAAKAKRDQQLSPG